MIIQVKPKHPQPPQTAQQPATAHKTISLKDYKPEAQKPPQEQIQPSNGKWDIDEFRKACNVEFVFHNQHIVTDDVNTWSYEQWDAYWEKCCDDFVETCRQNNFDPGNSLGYEKLLRAFEGLEKLYNKKTLAALEAYKETEATAAAADQEAAAL